MSVLKEKGDDLVLAWQKQASSGGGGSWDAGGGNVADWFGVVDNLAGWLEARRNPPAKHVQSTLTCCLQEAGSLACAADLEAAGGEESGTAEPGGKSPQEAEVGQLVIAPSVPWCYQVYVLAGRMFRMW